MKNLLITSLFLIIITSVFSQYAPHRVNMADDGYQTIEKNIIGNSTDTFFKNKSMVWSEAYNVSINVNQDSRDMDIAMTADSTIHMVYCDDKPGRQSITYKSKAVDGDWSEGIVIDVFDGVEPRNNHKASISASDNGDLHVAYHYWAYDGTFRNQICYSKYTAATGVWSTEIISGDGGTVESTFSDYPRITTTTSNYPVVVWGTDNRSGSDKAYLTYNDGVWHEPILISASFGGKAQWADATSIGDDQVFIIFREYNTDHTTLAYYYRIFDASTGSLSSIVKIDESERISTSTYDFYEQARVCSTNDGQVFMADNCYDTIQTYYYDVDAETLTQNEEVHISNINSYPNYNLLSVTADNENLIHIAYTIWNTSSNSLRHITFDKGLGFSASEIVSSNFTMDAPQIIYGVDDQLHMAFCDDSEDTNGDGYVDREVYYSFADITTGISDDIKLNNKSVSVYPNPSYNGVFKLNTDELFEVLVTDISGKFVLRTTSNQVIDLSDYPQGIYMLKGKNSVGMLSVMLVKQ